MAKAPAKSRAQWVDVIRGFERKTAQSLIELGRALQRAKADIPHGEFTKMLRDDLRMDVRFARALMRIGRSARFSKGSKFALLPPTLSALAVLAKSSEEDFKAAIASGAINPDMTARQAKRIKFTIVTEEPRTYRVPVYRVPEPETPTTRIPVYRERVEPEVPASFAPPVHVEPDEPSPTDDLVEAIDRVLELAASDAVLAEIEPGDREDLSALIESTIDALTTLHEALGKPLVEGQVVN
jgi:hypothetical protein